MPYIHVAISGGLSAGKKDEVKSMLGETISLLPGKKESSLMVQIDDEATLYFRGKADSCAILKVHLYKQSTQEAKEAYAEKVLARFCELTKLSPEQVFLNFSEHEDWAAGGKMIQR